MAQLELLDQRRRLLGYPRKYVAERIGVSPGMVSHIFSGGSRLTLERVWQLMDVCHIHPARMAEYFPNPNKKKGSKQMEQLLKVVPREKMSFPEISALFDAGYTIVATTEEVQIYGEATQEDAELFGI